MELSDFLEAAFDGNLEQVKHYLSSGTDINETAKNGSTALIFASQNDHNDVVKYLVSKGADVNLKNKVGGTALNRAADNANIDLMKFLLENGCEIGPLVLNIAARGGKLAAVKLLVEHGADVNTSSKLGTYPPSCWQPRKAMPTLFVTLFTRVPMCVRATKNGEYGAEHGQ